MSFKDNFKIIEIAGLETHEWLLTKHYAHRLPSIIHAFGLFSDNKMIGVITFGNPPCPTETMLWQPYFLYELNRLAVIDGLERGVLSFFVSHALEMLPKPCTVISYSDIDYGHHGYIYQATNWIYTGIGSVNQKRYLMQNGTERHSRNKNHINMRRVKEVKLSTGKHRYFYFLGSKKDKKIMKEMLMKRYAIKKYPKGENDRYAVGKINLQYGLGKFEAGEVSRLDMATIQVAGAGEIPAVRTNNIYI